jgi:hypothetical protein
MLFIGERTDDECGGGSRFSVKIGKSEDDAFGWAVEDGEESVAARDVGETRGAALVEGGEDVVVGRHGGGGYFMMLWGSSKFSLV